MPICGAVVLAVSGCGKKAAVKARMSELEEAFPTAAAAPAATASTGQGAASGEQPSEEANADVKAALAAMRTNDYAGGVIRLQLVTQTPGVTPAQLMAVQKAKQAMRKELVDRAANGDLSAKAALADIERTRSQ